MTASIVELELIEHLDFEFAPGCEPTPLVCENVATWTCRMSCCGRLMVICDAHRQFALVSEKVVLRLGHRCTFCKNVPENQIYIDWQPIKA